MNRMTYNETAPKRLDAWLKQQFKALSFVHVQKMLRKGLIKLNGKKAKGDERLAAGDSVVVPDHFAEAVETGPTLRLSAKEKEWFKSLIVHEQDDFLAINKPQGLATQGGTKINKSVDGYVNTIWGDGYKLVHRLDKDTTGLLLIAKHLEAAQHLTEQLRDHAVQKTYIAKVVGAPRLKSGIIQAHLCKKRIGGEEKVVIDPKDGKEAITEFKVLSTRHNISTLELKPKTGRMHQLRVHCSHLGCPIVGDKKYGYTGPRATLKLHATQLQFKYKGRALKLQAPEPQDF